MGRGFVALTLGPVLERLSILLIFVADDYAPIRDLVQHVLEQRFEVVGLISPNLRGHNT